MTKNLNENQNEYVLKEPNQSTAKTLAEKIGIVPTQANENQLDEKGKLIELDHITFIMFHVFNRFNFQKTGSLSKINTSSEKTTRSHA